MWRVFGILLVAGLFLPLAVRAAAAPEIEIVKVSDKVFRGPDPGADGIARLAKMGVTRIINLRTNAEATAVAEKAAKAHGIDYVKIPLTSGRAPSNAQVKQVLAAIESSKGPVYVHCELGKNRTGVIVACYQIEKMGWTNEKALGEADRLGMAKTYQEMREYIARYGK